MTSTNTPAWLTEPDNPPASDSKFGVACPFAYLFKF
jgi:hypothetical protein